MEDRCLFCNEIIPEGYGHVCPTCAAEYTPNSDVLEALVRQYPVEHKGVKYGCISAVTLRSRASHLKNLKQPIVQVELMSKNRGCIVVCDPKEVKILRSDEIEH